ncbi:hypothetical protein FA95DRAFT_1008921 [Auriscalpium vulgare]|uniref:Uncharacterized protein n=1 Tax=Auriscalpium vulgare TaxID=40419 RepID=A0ACB8RY77_9AGAM|nr:hypothetical protein FA95DRAFT_1008921 [Auriscalpium vulgare]
MATLVGLAPERTSARSAALHARSGNISFPPISPPPRSRRAVPTSTYPVCRHLPPAWTSITPLASKCCPAWRVHAARSKCPGLLIQSQLALCSRNRHRVVTLLTSDRHPARHPTVLPQYYAYFLQLLMRHHSRGAVLHQQVKKFLSTQLDGNK